MLGDLVEEHLDTDALWRLIEDGAPAGLPFIPPGTRPTVPGGPAGSATGWSAEDRRSAGSPDAGGRRTARPPPRLRPAGPVRLVAVDGPSGAGKSWFAARLAEALGAPVVHTDDLLDGWDDQFTFWDRLEEQVLEPLRHGRPGRYRRYLWHGGRSAGVRSPSSRLRSYSLEGVSAARRGDPPGAEPRRSSSPRPRRAAAGPGAWPATARDDVAFRAYLERWRVAEDRHFAADATAAHADLLVDGAATERIRRPVRTALAGGRRT